MADVGDNYDKSTCQWFVPNPIQNGLSLITLTMGKLPIQFPINNHFTKNHLSLISFQAILHCKMEMAKSVRIPGHINGLVQMTKETVELKSNPQLMRIVVSGVISMMKDRSMLMSLS